jgi:hypothetical protein
MAWICEATALGPDGKALRLMVRQPDEFSQPAQDKLSARVTSEYRLSFDAWPKDRPTVTVKEVQ